MFRLVSCLLFLVTIKATIQCTWVPYYQCKDTLYNFNIIIKQRSQNNKMSHTCCKKEMIIPYDNKGLLFNCGLRNIDGIFMHVTGDKSVAQYGEFPWMISILEAISIGTILLKRNICEGSLIHPKVVLTVSDCVRSTDLNTLIVRSGDWEADNTDEILNHEERNVKNIVYHIENKVSYLQIALLVLEKPFDLQSHISPICLRQKFNVIAHECLVTSWNHFKNDRDTHAILRKTQLNILSQNQCITYLNGSESLRNLPKYSSFSCFKESCLSQYGAPIVCRIKNTSYYVQIGIISKNPNCEGSELPTVYSNIRRSFVFKWLIKQLSENTNILD